MNRKNLFIVPLVAGALALPLLAWADSSPAPSGTETIKPAPAAPAQAASTTHSSATMAKPATSTSSSASHAHHSTMPKLDLNTATKEQLVKLPGMNEAAADKIIEARPFKSTSELVNKKLVTQAEFDKLRGHVMVKPAEAKKG